MDLPAGFIPKDIKNLTELLEEINKELKQKNKDSKEPYVMKVRCAYLKEGEVLLKVKGNDILGIKCRFYKKKDTHATCGKYNFQCYLMEKWKA